MGMDPEWSEHVLTVKTSVINVWRITVWMVSQNSLHSTHLRTKLYYGGYFFSSSRTKHIYPLRVASSWRLPTLSRCDAFLTLFPFLQAKHFHQSSARICPCTHRCHSFCSLVWDEISLFHTRQGFITIPSASPRTPPPPSHTLCTITICVSLKWSALTSQWSVVSILNLCPTCWPQWQSQWELQFVCVCANFHVCWWCGSVCHEKGCISATSHRTKVATAGGLVLHHAQHTQDWVLHKQSFDFPPHPLRRLITVGQQLCFHLRMPCMDTSVNTHTLTHSNTVTDPRLPAKKVEKEKITLTVCLHAVPVRSLLHCKA